MLYNIRLKWRLLGVVGDFGIFVVWISGQQIGQSYGLVWAKAVMDNINTTKYGHIFNG